MKLLYIALFFIQSVLLSQDIEVSSKIIYKKGINYLKVNNGKKKIQIPYLKLTFTNISNEDYYIPLQWQDNISDCDAFDLIVEESFSYNKEENRIYIMNVHRRSYTDEIISNIFKRTKEKSNDTIVLNILYNKFTNKNLDKCFEYKDIRRLFIDQQFLNGRNKKEKLKYFTYKNHKIIELDSMYKLYDISGLLTLKAVGKEKQNSFLFIKKGESVSKYIDLRVWKYLNREVMLKIKNNIDRDSIGNLPKLIKEFKLYENDIYIMNKNTVSLEF